MICLKIFITQHLSFVFLQKLKSDYLCIMETKIFDIKLPIALPATAKFNSPAFFENKKKSGDS